MGGECRPLGADSCGDRCDGGSGGGEGTFFAGGGREYDGEAMGGVGDGVDRYGAGCADCSGGAGEGVYFRNRPCAGVFVVSQAQGGRGGAGGGAQGREDSAGLGEAGAAGGL